MRKTLELLRIVVIIGLFMTLGWIVIENIYTINETTQNYSWFGSLAILILLLFYTEINYNFQVGIKEKAKKLSKKIPVILISLSVVLTITPFILSSLLG